MDEKTAELRDIFIDATGSDTVTERQEASRGSLTADEEAAVERVGELVERMRERYAFESGLGDDALVRVVEGYFAGRDDEALAADLNVDAERAFRARMDLHLVRPADREAPFEFDRLRELLAEGTDDEALAAALDVDVETARRYRRVAESDAEATRANDRFRDEFAELLTDSDLEMRHARDAREDGLREATEDIEVDVSF